MNPTGKKFISSFLVFSLLMLSVNLYAKEKRGATLIITKLDGQLKLEWLSQIIEGLEKIRQSL